MAAASSEASLNPMDARRNIKLYIVCFSGIFSNSAATLEQTIEFIDHENFIAELIEIIEQENIKDIFVGNPLNMYGSKGPSSQSALDKAKIIEIKTNIPVALWDEMLSTVGAFKISSQLDINVSKRVKKIDENAAAFILQGAIEFLNN